jgi:hypothetical protein
MCWDVVPAAVAVGLLKKLTLWNTASLTDHLDVA